MAEDNKDSVVIKPPKKSPLLLKISVLMFAMVFGIYICTISLKQISIQNKMKFQSIQVIETPYREIGVKLQEIQYVHYPNPKTFIRAECAHNPVRFFVILSMQRSGSGWFESLLNSHVNVSSNGEIFSVKSRRENLSSIIQRLDKVYNLDWFSSASKNECSAAVGLKWMLNQGLIDHHKEVVEYFNRRGVSAIFLFRKNLLRRMVSDIANSYDRIAKLLNGTHKSHVHSVEEVSFSYSVPHLHDPSYVLNLICNSMQAKKLSKFKPTINSMTLISDLKKMELIAAKALEYFNTTRHMVLYYEDIVNSPNKLKDVLDFLRLPYMELSSRQVKIHQGSLRDHIENWNDVNKTLTGTTYEDFLQSDY